MTEHREAKAAAKAEKARAKAMRPWWKKKRFVLPLGVVAVAVVAAVAGGGASSDNDNGGTTSETASGVDSVFSSNTKNPPADDVEVTSCEKTIIDTVEVGLRVTNHSSKASDYTITLSVEDAAGNKVGDGFASTSNLDPGQTANIEGVADLTGSPASFTCVLEEVERFAS